MQYDSEANKYNNYTHFFHAGRKRAVAGPLPKELFTKVFLKNPVANSVPALRWRSSHSGISIQFM